MIAHAGRGKDQSARRIYLRGNREIMDMVFDIIDPDAQTADQERSTKALAGIVIRELARLANPEMETDDIQRIQEKLDPYVHGDHGGEVEGGGEGG